MELKQNAKVKASDDEDVGRVDRVVIDPRSNRVTHIVVRRGFLFGEDRVVPADLIAEATEENVWLRAPASDLAHLPVFEETHYIPLDRSTPSERSEFATPLYWYPPAPGVPVPFPIQTEVPHLVEVEKNIPAGSVALREGASVHTSDDKSVGKVEEVLVDPDSGRATHFLISKGIFLKDRKLVPATWIDKITEDEVDLAVESGVLERLPEHHASV